jgi:hypothetical protein
LSPVERAVVLACADGGDADEVARLPIGRRDERVLRLRSGELEATAACPRCGVDAEFSLAVDALLARADEASAPEPIDAGGRVISWRPPDSRDMSVAAHGADAAAAEQVLVERCVGVSDLSESERRALSVAMAEADPLAEVLVDMACPACGEAFVAELDVAQFVWSEVRARALGLLRDVDTLARAYGWTEEQVLALGDSRRRAYLDLAEGAA